MATVVSTDSGAPPGQTGDSGAPLDLAGKISRTEGELNDLKNEIKKLNKSIVADDFKGTIYDDRTEAKAALQRLEAEKTRLDERLNTLYETQKLTAQQQQQQQGGAGAPMRRCVLCKQRPHREH